MIRRPPKSALVPYTTLFRSRVHRARAGLTGAARRFASVDSDADALGVQPGQRVDLLAVRVPDLEVQVRTGGETAVAHARDLLARQDLLALAHGVGVHVAVDGHGAVRVLDLDPEAKTACGTGLDHDTIRGGQDRGADGAGDVDAVVHLAPATTPP